MLETVKRRGRPIERDIVMLYVAARDRHCTLVRQGYRALVAAYALSPIDFIPVFGYLDDLIVVPAGILLAVRLTPPDVLMDLRAQAARQPDRPKSYTAAAAVPNIAINLIQ
jgi:uncharacterized membrane protein YkvA (DUF1232 family)